MAPVLNAAAAMALAGSASAFVAPSAFSGAAVSSKTAPSSTQLSMSVDTGINGFGRIGRLVARSMVKNPETNLKLINTGAAPEYMAYQVRVPASVLFNFCVPWSAHLCWLSFYQLSPFALPFEERCSIFSKFLAAVCACTYNGEVAVARAACLGQPPIAVQ